MASRLERLIGIEKVIRTGHYPGVSDLCHMFEIQPRTLFQDIKELRENVGCQIKFDRTKQGYYSTNPQHQLPSFSLTEDEMFVLIVATELFSQVSGTSISTQLKTAISKIAQENAPGWKEQVDSIKSVIRSTAPKIHEVGLNKLRTICSACLSANLILIGPDGKEQMSSTSEIVEPHYLEHALSRWFLVGFSRNNKRMFHRALDSITVYETMETSFERRTDLISTQ